MARETRTSGNAAASAAAAGSTNGTSDAASGSSAKKADPPAFTSNADASPSKKRKRGGPAAATSATKAPPHANGTASADSPAPEPAASPVPALAPTVLGKRLKVVLKTRKASTSAPAEAAAEPTGEDGVTAGEPGEDDPMEDGEKSEAAEADTALATVPAPAEDESVAVVADTADDVATLVDPPRKSVLSARIKEGLLAVMLAMESTLLPALAESTHLVDIPLTLSSPAAHQPAEPAAERPAKKGKKSKGKGKLQDAAADKEDATPSQIEGVWSLRRALSEGVELTIDDLESHLFELAGQCVPAPQNPFHPYPATLAGPSARMAPTPLSEFFAALHGVAARIRAEVGATRDVKPTVRFALQQRLHVPGFGTVGREGVNQGMQDWFSSLIAMPEIVHAGKNGGGQDAASTTGVGAPLQAQGGAQAGEVQDDDSIVTRLLLDRKMGHAQPVLVAPTDASGIEKLAVPGQKLHMDPRAYAAIYGPPGRRGHADPPISLGQSILTQASRKVASWRNRKERSRPMGWTGKPVKFPAYENTFTPSFAPMMDSSDTTGGWGYEQTVDAYEVRAARRAWLDAGWGPEVGAEWEDELEETSHEPNIDAVKHTAHRLLAEALGDKANGNIDPLLVDAVVDSSAAGMQIKLDENAWLMQELMVWQDVRVRRGQAEVVDEREQETAARLAQNLSELVAHTTPGTLLKSSEVEENANRPPLAVVLAEKIISTAGPRLRGTLDPQRSRALVDNATVRLKPDAVALARPPPPPLPAVPRQPVATAWGRPGYPPSAYNRPPPPPGYPAPPLKYPPGTPQPYRPPQPAYSSPLAYPPQRPAMYSPSPSGLSPYPSPGTQHPPRGRPPAARGVGAGMGLSIQNMMPGTPGYPAQRPSGLRGQLG